MGKLLPAEQKELEERKLMDFYLNKIHGGEDVTDNFRTIQQLLDQSSNNISKVELERILDKIYKRGHIDISNAKDRDYFMQYDGIDFINNGGSYVNEYLKERSKRIAEIKKEKSEAFYSYFDKANKVLSPINLLITIILGVFTAYLTAESTRQNNEIDELKAQNKELVKKVEKLEKGNTFTIPSAKPKFDLPIRK